MIRDFRILFFWRDFYNHGINLGLRPKAGFGNYEGQLFVPKTIPVYSPNPMSGMGGRENSSPRGWADRSPLLNSRVSKCLDRNSQNGQFAGLGDNPLPHLFLDHEHQQPWFIFLSQKIPDEMRGQIIRDVGHDFIGALDVLAEIKFQNILMDNR